MNNFIKFFIIILTLVSSIFIIISLTTVGIVIVSILFIVLFIFSIISKITGSNLYNTRFVYSTINFHKYNNNEKKDDINIYDLSSDEYSIEDKSSSNKLNNSK